MQATDPSVLAIDLGGTSLRAALVGPGGAVRFPFRRAHRTEAEAEPGQWWSGLLESVAAIAREAPSAFERVEAVCITGITRTQVLLDRDGTPLRPAITFADARAAGLLPGLPRLEHAEADQLNTYHPAIRLLWVARHEPAVLAEARAVVDPKDYLAARLTGRVCTDPISAARLLAAARPPGASLLDQLGVPGHLLPEVLPPTTVIGPVRADIEGPLRALSGRPVVMAAHDTWACVLGLGALMGSAYNISGTTEVLGLLSRRRAATAGLLDVEWGDGLYQLGGPSNAGGATVSWVAGLLASDEPVGAALDRLLSAPRQSEPVLFLPYLQGERTPHWDPALRGAFLGLGTGHGPADLAWAALEGVACLNRLVLERAEAAVGRAEEIRFGGGGAASARWAQVKADMLGRPVVTTQEAEAGLLGAGIVGWTALGLASSLQDGQKRMVRIARRFEPIPDHRSFYDRLYAAYRAADDAVAPISHLLARFG